MVVPGAVAKLGIVEYRLFAFVDVSPYVLTHSLSLPLSFNQAKPKSEVEARVYEVLSHKNWGSSSTLMNEVARDTYDSDKCEYN